VILGVAGSNPVGRPRFYPASRHGFAVEPETRGGRNGGVGFFLKKLLGYMLMPVPLAALLVLAAVALRWVNLAPRARRWLIVAAAGGLVLLGNNGVANLLVRPLERQFPPVPELAAGVPVPTGLAGCKWVVVLGSGHADADGFSANNQLSPAGIARLTEGVRLMRALPPDTRLVVSGPGPEGRPSHAEVLVRAAVALGVARERIVKIETARDTEDEAGEVQKIAGGAAVALVTSAWHMPRALALFRHAGADARPCPADFASPPRAGEGLAPFFGWSAEGIQRSTWAIRERIGWLWVWLRGRTTPAAEQAKGAEK
jgi:uncharacterized SAM-binding protein YcdF (DUF218 family)